jgi:phosphoribosylformylglycinamidine (FGAM) synthase-like enzyme
VIGVLGVIEDVARRIRPGFARADENVVLLGTTRDEFGGSEWAHVVHGHLGGRPPSVDLDAEQRLGALLATASTEGLVSGAHDLSDGGLAQALVESCLVGGIGVVIDKLPHPDPFVALFAESAARMLVTVSDEQVGTLLERAAAAGVPATTVGRTGGATLTVATVTPLALDELRTAWESTLPALFG